MTGICIFTMGFMIVISAEAHDSPESKRQQIVQIKQPVHGKFKITGNKQINLTKNPIPKLSP